MMPSTIVQNVVKCTCATEFASEPQQKHWTQYCGTRNRSGQEACAVGGCEGEDFKTIKRAVGKV